MFFKNLFVFEEFCIKLLWEYWHFTKVYMHKFFDFCESFALKGVIMKMFVNNCIDLIELYDAVFCIWKSLRVLQKVGIKIVAHAICTYLFFSYTCTLLFCWKMKSCFDRCFPQQIRPQTTVQSYILQDYSSVRIGFNMINKSHTLPIVCIHHASVHNVHIVVVLLIVKRSMW